MPKKREIKRLQAEKRQKKYDNMTVEEKVQLLDSQGYKAEKQRKKLEKEKEKKGVLLEEKNNIKKGGNKKNKRGDGGQ